MQRLLGSLFLVLIFVSGPAIAYEAAYVSQNEVDLAHVLAPPPLPQSDLQSADLKEVLEAQEHRTPQQAKRAIADNDGSIYRIAGEVLGPNFRAERLPKLDAFFKRLIADTRAVFLATKDVWNRPRPFEVSSEVHAVGKQPTNGSYPSGHATRGYVTAIILANMVPEKSAELFARGREYGVNRVVAGVHFPTDIEAGRIAGSILANAFMHNAAFMQDFTEAKVELRGVLGLPQQ